MKTPEQWLSMRCFLIVTITSARDSAKRNMQRTERFYKAFSMLKQINLGQFDIIRRSFPSSPPGNAGLVIEASRIVFRGSDIKVFNAVRKLADSVAIGVSETNKTRIQFWFN